MGAEETAAGVRTTFAFAMAAPEGSVTCPRKAPEPAGAAAVWVAGAWAAGVCVAGVWAAPVCDGASGAHIENDTKITVNHKYFRNFIQYSIP
jgi:hypothetical protein